MTPRKITRIQHSYIARRGIEGTDAIYFSVPLHDIRVFASDGWIRGAPVRVTITVEPEPSND